MLEIARLSVRYGKRTALADASLTVDAGQLVTIIGANGAGKSTTLKAIAGLLPAASGQVILEGRDITKTPSHERVAMGMVLVPEGRQLFPHLTVRDHLELGYRAARRRGADQSRLLDRCHGLFPILSERVDQYAGTLSGGQQQMVAIARGLMTDPRLLFLDEPTLGLAPLVIDTVADALRTLRSQGMTILLVEQRVDLALSLADRGYVLEAGRLVGQGTSHDLEQDPKVREAFLGLSSE